MNRLDQCLFDDLFVRSLPQETATNPGATVPHPVLHALHSPVLPTPVRSPRLVAWSDPAAALLGVSRPDQETGAEAEILGGNRVTESMRPFATCYGGHQFGHWAGQLGDGRAMSLGSLNGWEVQLKGAGMTPYSRRADGRAVMRSSIREFLCSEAMHALGVPTTRALCLVATGSPVLRDMFYDGHPAPEPGAICTRLSHSFLRFGHFELPAQRGDLELLRKLVDFTRTTYFPEHATSEEWFAEICRRTAAMVIEWLRVGFVHGVMNTDNMSILGLTIDYGPYGWLDSYEPSFTPNTTDQSGRYAYGRQGSVALWNLDCLAAALEPVVQSTEALEAGLRVYAEEFNHGYPLMMAQKLGLRRSDEASLEQTVRLLSEGEVDPTRFFRRLGQLELAAPVEEWGRRLADTFYTPPPQGRLSDWLTAYRDAAAAQGVSEAERRATCLERNPRIIPRNFLVQEVIEQAEGGSFEPIGRMLQALQRPYDEATDEYDRLRPEEARHAPGCSQLSCSS